MQVVVRIVAVLAGVSVVGTIGLIALFASRGNVLSLLSAGWLGALTFAGWVVTLIAGPIAAIQIWRLRESGRLAGLVLFGAGLAYYVVGGFLLRSAEASAVQIAAAASMYALPVAVLLSPQARALFTRSASPR